MASDPADAAPLHLPPQNEDAERAVCGSLLLDNSAISEIADLLTPEDFYSKVNGEIYRTLSENLTDGRPMDTLLLANAMKGSKELKVAGGTEYLAKLLDSTSSAALCRYQGELVRECALKRGVIAAAETFLEEGRNGKPVAEVLASHRVRVDDLEREAGSSALRTVRASDLAALEVPPMVSLLGPKVLCAGGYMSIAGAPGLGKSYLALDLSLRLACGDGGEWLGLAVAPVKVPTLWLWGEGGMAAVKDRAMNMTHGEGLPDNLHFYTPQEMALDLSNPRDASKVRASLDRIRGDAPTVLLVVDPQSEWTLHDENKEAALFLRAISGFRNRAKATVLVLNHKRKPQQGEAKGDPVSIRGDSKIHGALDAALMLDREGDGLVRATWGKLRDAPPMEALLLRLNSGEEGDFRFKIVSSLGDRTRAVDRVMQALRDAHEMGSGWLTRKQIAIEAGVNERSLERYISKLLKQGQIERDGSNGALSSYRLADG